MQWVLTLLCCGLGSFQQAVGVLQPIGSPFWAFSVIIIIRRKKKKSPKTETGKGNGRRP